MTMTNELQYIEIDACFEINQKYHKLKKTRSFNCSNWWPIIERLIDKSIYWFTKMIY